VITIHFVISICSLTDNASPIARVNVAGCSDPSDHDDLDGQDDFKDRGEPKKLGGPPQEG
jgi:hypothetical protein